MRKIFILLIILNIALLPIKLNASADLNTASNIFQQFFAYFINYFNQSFFSSNDAPILISSSLSLSSPNFGYRLGQLFVLGNLFRGNSNGILSDGPGVSLGDIFILDQLFR